MSITFSVANYHELVNNELITEEQKKAYKDWYENNDDNTETWNAYNNLIKPIESKYELNMSNDKAYELLGLLGMEKDCCGAVEGIELETFLKGLKSLLATAQGNPVEFSSKPIEYKGAKGATVISCGTNAGYWERICKKLIELAESTTGISWG